ncbi:MAG: hypothetical protein U9P71_00190 [Campylobacterota bacterium]|nr:hypothetical protein [Campylobacterota bacterium]
MQQESDLYEEVEDSQSVPEQYFGLSWSKLFVALFLVVFLGIYIGILLFGENSLEVLFQLEEYEDYLISETDRLKIENSNLQKEYFELKGLQADSNLE